MTDPKEKVEAGKETPQTLLDKQAALDAKQMATGVVDVVETTSSSPAEGWNKDIEINNLQDANSRNMPSPRRAVNATYAGSKLNVVGADVVPPNVEATGPAENGNVVSEGNEALGLSGEGRPAIAATAKEVKAANKA